MTTVILLHEYRICVKGSKTLLLLFYALSVSNPRHAGIIEKAADTAIRVVYITPHVFFWLCDGLPLHFIELLKYNAHFIASLHFDLFPFPSDSIFLNAQLSFFFSNQIHKRIQT